MDPHQVVFLRVRAGRQSTLAALPQHPGSPVYGSFREQQAERIIQLQEGATVGFLGTNIACTAVADSNAPAVRCLAHGAGGLPGPCCGRNYTLLVKSKGFFLTPRRLQALLVITNGVTQVGNGGTAHPLRPYRVIADWHL